MRLLFSALLVLSIITSQASAATFYVSTTGNNANNGLTEAAPKRTVAHCVSIMVAGDTCLVRGGTYTGEGTIRFGVSGTQALPIRLRNYPGEKPHIQYSSQITTNRIYVEHATAPNIAIGWITIEGFEISGGWEGIKFINLHNGIIRNNTIHHGRASGIFGAGGHHNLFDRNVIYHQGAFAQCAAGTVACTQDHGMYMHGDSYTITNNVIYDNLAIGIQQNGSGTSDYTTARHPSPAFSGASNWIVTSNTFAYQSYGAGYTMWGLLTNNTRIENNIFYENQQAYGSSSAQGVFFTSAFSTGSTIRNNHSYATASPGGTPFLRTTGATEGVNYTQSGNLVNISNPRFVNGPSVLPLSPNFALTVLSPAIDIGLVQTVVPFDFKGVSRPQGAGYDAGAYEFQGSIPAITPPAAPSGFRIK